MPTRAAPAYPAVGAEQSLKDLALQHGLAEAGRRPGMGPYLTRLWGRRHFVLAFATARLVAQNTTARLGQLWQVLTPLLHCAVFYVVFGVMMRGRDGVDQYIPWLCVGVFLFRFTQGAVTAGTRAVSGNLKLIRALYFPRATLPIAVTIVQLQQLLVSMIVLAGIVLLFQPPSFSWLMLPPLLFLLFLFSAGLALATARFGAQSSDLAKLMPFVLRTWMYVSGVMYSVQQATATWPSAVKTLLDINPMSVYLNLGRYAFLPNGQNHDALPQHAWAIAATWAGASLILGFGLFWKAEEEYGRG